MGLDGSNPLLSASQSAIFAFSAENSKILRIFADFVRLKGTGEAQIRPTAADLCSILSVENRAGALRSREKSDLILFNKGRFRAGDQRLMDRLRYTSGRRPRAMLCNSRAVCPCSGRPVRRRPEEACPEKGKPARPLRKEMASKSKSNKLVCRYCGSDDLAPSFIKRRDRRVQEDDFGRLHRIQFYDYEPLLMVEVVNATSEPDGSVRRHLLRLPPEMETAHAAVAWSFGRRTKDYAPVVQTRILE
jgi:hypothetical protein